MGMLLARFRREIAQGRAGFMALVRARTILRGADQAWHMLVQGGLVVATPPQSPMLMTLVQPDGDIVLRADPALLRADFDAAQRDSLMQLHGADVNAAIAPLRVAALGGRDLFAGVGVLHRATLLGSGIWGFLNLLWSGLSSASVWSLIGLLYGPALGAIVGSAMLLLRRLGVRVLRRRLAGHMAAMQDASVLEAKRLRNPARGGAGC